jgi:hypothetical protein
VRPLAARFDRYGKCFGAALEVNGQKNCFFGQGRLNFQAVNAKSSLYVETTIPSYLAARVSYDPLIAGQQAATRTWWRLRRQSFELFTSQFVLNEAALGEAKIAAKRLQILRPMEKLPVTPEGG